jgi:hypothetical protein
MKARGSIEIRGQLVRNKVTTYIWSSLAPSQWSDVLAKCYACIGVGY